MKPTTPITSPSFRYIGERDHAGADGLKAFAERQEARRKAMQPALPRPIVQAPRLRKVSNGA